MKKIIILLLTIGTIGISYAQQSVEIRLAGGIAIPTSNFASYSSNSIGYAEQGYKGGIELGYSIHKNWSLSFAVDYGYHGTNATKIAKEYLQTNPAYTKAEVVSGSFNILSALIGIEPTINLTNKLYLQGQVAIGICNVKGPDNIAEISFSSPFEEKVSAGSSNAFAYQGRIALKYAIGKRFDFGVFGSYFGTNPKFSIVDTATDDRISVKQKIGIITPGIQIIYKL